MPLITDDENAETERIALEEADRLFQQRLEAGAERARLAREAEKQKIRDAEAVLATADPMLIAEEKYRAAIAGADLRDQRASPPSLGGVTPAQAELLSRQQIASERAYAADIAARARWVESQEDVIRQLEAGQSEDNKRLIRAQFYAQRAR